MQIYIDESGSFSGFLSDSLSVVGALCIPDGSLPKILQKYERIRKSLPLTAGEVKGKDLTELQVDRVAQMLRRNGAILELTVIDLKLHSKDLVLAYRDALAGILEERKHKFNAATQPEIELAVARIKSTSPQLFLQAMATFDLLQNVVHHIPTYFAQRQPHELAKFSWIIDAKEKNKTIAWERWWFAYCHGALANMSRTHPAPTLEGADYTHFKRYDGLTDLGGGAIDLKLLISDLRFSSEPDPGLELVDIVTNAARRALLGHLSHDGWKNIPSLMIHRPHNYISFVLLGEAREDRPTPAYASTVMQFSNGGRNMLTPSFSRLADEQED